MVYLFWHAQDFGLAQQPEVKAAYVSFEDAYAQAQYDVTLGRHPLRIEDADTQEVLWRLA